MLFQIKNPCWYTSIYIHITHVISGVIYNLMKRSKGEKGMELESNLGSDYDEEEDEDGSDYEDGDEEGSDEEDHDNKSAFKKIQPYDS